MPPKSYRERDEPVITRSKRRELVQNRFELIRRNHRPRSPSPVRYWKHPEPMGPRSPSPIKGEGIALPPLPPPPMLPSITERTTELKTSEEWQREYPVVVVTDPDGWDRLNWRYSWFEEKIPLGEYRARRLRSTCKDRFWQSLESEEVARTFFT